MYVCVCVVRRSLSSIIFAQTYFLEFFVIEANSVTVSELK